MKLAAVLFAATFLASVQAHTLVYQVSGSTTGLRSIVNNSPVTDVSSQDIKCNVGNPQAVTPRDVAPGQDLFFSYRHDVPNDDIMASSHLGPCMVYAARYPAESDWIKLWHEGLTNGQWCTTKMIANKGFGITLPSNMPSGRWVLRIEVLALHSAYASGGAQFYMRCMDINVSGSNSGSPSPTIKFPGGYKSNDPGILFNLYTTPPPSSYTVPGGSVGSFSGSSSGGNTGGNGGQSSPSPSPRTSPASSPASSGGNCVAKF
ncbi:hypothetical protein HK098_007505 [Nowakowskiella sp. JEL0407]|nr:hypothetical protein HK098_007505 [Nowakowskiella sp. JEL0407]